MVRDLLHELMQGPAAASVERALDLAVATMACHASVRAGKRLGEAEVAALLEALDQVERSGHCPHGRPVVVRLGESEIRRRFRRD
jgi:DNA mismatch repair protein MutL